MKCSEKEEQEASVFTATTSSPNVSAVEREKKVISIWFYWSLNRNNSILVRVGTANNTDQSHNLANQAQAQ